MKVPMMILLVALASFGQEAQKPIQDLNLLVGKHVIVQRMPLCQPGTYTIVLAYAGKQAKVISLKPSNVRRLSEESMSRLAPGTRAMMEDAQKAATILIQFEDGTQLDSCGAVGPSRLSDYFELAPGETLQPLAQGSPTSLVSSTPIAAKVDQQLDQNLQPRAQASPITSDPRAAAANLQPGAYYWNGSWTLMQTINMSGGGTKHVGKMFVPGLTPQMVWTFRDPQAPVQVHDGKPLFCFKFIAVPPGMPYAPSGRDIVIARFDQKKDHRELQTTSGGNMFTFKAGLSKERTPDIDITEVDQSTYLVVPKIPIAPGEYLVSASAMGISGYDFGFHPAQ